MIHRSLNAELLCLSKASCINTIGDAPLSAGVIPKEVWEYSSQTPAAESTTTLNSRTTLSPSLQLHTALACNYPRSKLFILFLLERGLQCLQAHQAQAVLRVCLAIYTITSAHQQSPGFDHPYILSFLNRRATQAQYVSFGTPSWAS
jgi:hypothetical protein